MELLESKVGSSVFLEALTGVNMEIARKRVERKRQRAVEKATDPVATAERRKMRLEAGKVGFHKGDKCQARVLSLCVRSNANFGGGTTFQARYRLYAAFFLI